MCRGYRWTIFLASIRGLMLRKGRSCGEGRDLFSWRAFAGRWWYREACGLTVRPWRHSLLHMPKWVPFMAFVR